MREKSCERQSCSPSLVGSGLDAGVAWGAERTVVAEATA